MFYLENMILKVLSIKENLNYFLFFKKSEKIIYLIILKFEVVMEKTYDELNTLVGNIPSDKIKDVQKFIENRLVLLKIFYDESKDTTARNDILGQISYEDLKSFLKSKELKSEQIFEGASKISLHIKTISGNKKNGIPTEKNIRNIDLYNFYFGGYRKLFTCFTRKFLTSQLEKKILHF